MILGMHVVVLSLLAQTIDCRDGGTTQLEMNVCAERAASAAEARLDDLVEELRDTLESERWKELRRVQARWTDYVANDCGWEREFFTDGASPTASPMVFSRCLETRIEERIDRLKIFLCEGWGMTGPCDASRKYDAR